MKEKPVLTFDIDSQLAQIESFTRQQASDVRAMIARSKDDLEVLDPDQQVDEIEKNVTGLLDSLGAQLEQEINKINQQLQDVLPKDV